MIARFLAVLDATTVTPAIAGATIVLLLLAMDVYIVGLTTWDQRTRRLGAKLADWILGVEECRAGEKQIPFMAYVPMPEGNYVAKITFRPYTYSRRRWFATRILRAHVVMQQPIPIPPPSPRDVKANRRRLTEDQGVYFVMVPNAPTIEAAALYVREYALNLRAKYVFENGANVDRMRSHAH